MGKKGKNKPQRKGSNNNTVANNNKNGTRQQQQGGKNKKKNRKQHKDPHWKAGTDDPVRKTVEADGNRTVMDMAADGNCLFRALSDGLFYDYGNEHATVRSEVCDYLEAYKDEFCAFLVLDDDDEDASDFESYVDQMREDGQWGGNLELVAAARLYRRDIVVFSADLAAMTIPHGCTKKNSAAAASGHQLLLSYHDNEHYNSVRDNSLSNKPPPPIRTFSKQKSIDPPAAGEVEQCRDPEEESAPSRMNLQNGIEKKAVKRSTPCPCGSNLKYKRCCGSKEKLKRAQQMNELDVVEPEILEGGFRVLKI